MTSFWTFAFAIALIACAVILVPLLRAHFADHGKTPRPGLTIGTGAVIALLLPVAALMLYAHWTSWNWGNPAQQASESEETHSMEEAISNLEARLRQQPGDVNGWRMLGRSYMSMREFKKALVAFQKAVELTGGAPEDQADYAEALALTDPEGLQGEAGDIFRELVESAPENPKVLWYGGLTAFESGNEAEGERLWSRLLELEPPDAIRQIVEERMGETTSPAAEPAAVAETPSPTDATPEDGITLTISIDPALVSRLGDPVPLFIFARAGQGAGPPLAVIRRSSAELPLAVNLSDQNAMTDGVSLLDHEELTLVARLAIGGSPAANSGDLFGEVKYSRSNGPRTAIVIDQVVP